MNVSQSTKYRKYIDKRSDYLHVRYLRLFFTSQGKEQLVEDFYALVLTYLDDHVYKIRHFALCKQIRCPGSLTIVLLTLKNQWKVRRYPRFVVLRCVQELIDQETTYNSRFVKLCVAQQHMKELRCHVVRFVIAKLYVEDVCYDMNCNYVQDDFHFAKKILML